MQDLSLKQMNDFGISKLMSGKEVEKAIVKALEQQQASLNTEEVIKEQASVAQQTLDEVLKDGGLFTYILNGKKYKINVLTKSDMNTLDNSSNYVEDGVEYNIVKPFRYSIRNSHDNYVTLQSKTYEEAQKVVDSIYGGVVFLVSASKL